MTTERHDPELANRHARQRPREKNASPHYVRCEWYRDESRCLLADGHAGEHKYRDKFEAEK